MNAAKSWAAWELNTSKLLPNNNSLHSFDDPKAAEAFARIECHYFINGGFFKTDEWILENVHTISDIPTVIIQGRYDVVCPITSAWELYKKLPKSDFHIVQNAGHSMTEKGITSKLVEYTDTYLEL